MAEARRPRLRRYATRPAVWSFLILALTLIACADPPSPAGAGSPCAASPTTPCLDGLVCLDGVCLPRGELPAPAIVGLPPTVSFDVPAPPTADTDASDELDAYDAIDDSSPPTDDSTDVVPDGADPDSTPPPELILVGAFDEALPSNMQLLLARGQAAVIEVFVPVAGRPELVRAHVQAPPLASGATTCARYRAVLWSPRALDLGAPGDANASFDLQPDLVGPEVLVPVPAGARLALDLPLVGPDPSSPPPPAAVAPHRVGARYEGPCAGAQHVPWIQLDASGDNSQSFIWAETWIPGPDLQLPGRWGLLLGLAPPP